MTDVTREEIERLRYLNNPRTAAVYLGIPQAQVEDVWAEMPVTRLRSNDRTYSTESSGIAAHMTARELARSGSHKLRQATVCAIIRWADSNERTIDEAAGFLLSGKDLQAA